MTTARITVKRPRPKVCLSMPGAGTCLGVIAGALEVLEDDVDFTAVGGTSGGGLVALALARGLTPAQISIMLGDLLARKDLLDSPFLSLFDSSPGLFKGDVVEKLLKEIFGPSVKMADLKLPARVTAWDSWTRQPVVVDSLAHRDVYVWRAALVTMSIEFFFNLKRLRPDNARLYGDGGLVLNVPHGLWDDRPQESTLGLRFADQALTFDLEQMIAAGHGNANTARVQRVTSWTDLAKAVAAQSINTAASAWPSKKPHGVPEGGFHEVVLETDANAFEFGLPKSEIDRRRQQGRLSAHRAKLAL